MAKKAQIKGPPEEIPAKLKRWIKSEYYDQEKFYSNLVSFSLQLSLFIIRLVLAIRAAGPVNCFVPLLRVLQPN